MDIKSKKCLKKVLLFLLIFAMTGGIVYGISMFRVEDKEMGDTSNLEKSFVNSEYYEGLLNNQLQHWIINKNLCDRRDGSIDLYDTEKTNISVMMRIQYHPTGKKAETKVYTSDKNVKERDFEKSIAGAKTFRVILNRDTKLKSDGSLKEKYAYQIQDGMEADEKRPSDFYTIYSNGGFVLSLPESFFVNDAQQTRIERGKITVGLPQKTFAAYEKKYNQYVANQKSLPKKWSGVILGELLCFVLVLILLGLEDEAPIFIQRLNRIWYEIMFGIIMVLGFVFVFGFAYGASAVSVVSKEGLPLLLLILGILFFCGMCFLVLCIHDFLWRIKEGRFIESTFCIGVTKRWYLKRRERRSLEIQSMKFRDQQMAEHKRYYSTIRTCIIASMVGGVFMVGSEFDQVFPGISMLVIIFVGLAVIFFLNKQYDVGMREPMEAAKLVEQIEGIAEGDFDYESEVPTDSIYHKASEKLSHIGSGMEEALEKQMRDERMKIDLITNVSHDLKTPLTSMVGYIDLLAQEKSLSLEAKDYVKILGNKTQRLQQLILDLFELAKATSGDVKVELTKMNMRRLVEQVMIEMADQMEASGILVVYEDHSTRPMFLGDIQRMYRVVQNILENALKYSLQGTRIFVEVQNIKDEIVLSVKNTASYEMNFTEDEIMERFARGDKARSSDGTGLGLSIADSFTNNCDGKLDVEIDGDQFKVIIRFLALNESSDMI